MRQLFMLYRRIPGWWNGNTAFNFTVGQFASLMLGFEFGPLKYEMPSLNKDQAFRSTVKEGVARNYYGYSKSLSVFGLFNWLGQLDSPRKKWSAIFEDVLRRRPEDLIAQQTNKDEVNLELSSYAVGGIYTPEGLWDKGPACNSPYSWGNSSIEGSINPPPRGFLYSMPGGNAWYFFTQLQAETFRNDPPNCAGIYGP